jgi:hypothetical protein
MEPEQSLAILYNGIDVEQLDRDFREVEEVCKRIGTSEVLAMAKIVAYREDRLRNVVSYTLR